MKDNKNVVSTENVLDIKFSIDSIMEAITLAIDNKVDSEILVDLSSRRDYLEATMGVRVKEVLKHMSTDTNLYPLQDGWYGVRVTLGNKGATGMKFLTVNDKDLYMLELDANRKHDFSESEIESLLPAIENMDVASKYKEETCNHAYMMLVDLGVDLSNKKEPVDIRISAHACKRWVQRKLGVVNESKAEAYRKQHQESINQEILSQYSKSTLVWTDEGDIQYWLDEENIIYVVGTSTIITLYEEDFGFSKEINREIVTSQLKVLHDERAELEDCERNHWNRIEQVDKEVSQYDKDISLLQSQIEEIESKKIELSAHKDVMNKVLSTKKQKFVTEFNKLFRRHGKN